MVTTTGNRRTETDFTAEPLLQQRYVGIRYYQGGVCTVIPRDFAAKIDKETGTGGAAEDLTLLAPRFDRNGVMIPPPAEKVRTTPLSDTMAVSFVAAPLPKGITPDYQGHGMELMIRMADNHPAADGVWVETLTEVTTIVVKRRHRILLANTYATSTSTDAVYYIMACYEQLGLSHTDTAIFVIDAATAPQDTLTSSVTALIKPYIASVDNLTAKIWDELPHDVAMQNNLNCFALQILE